MAPSKLLAGGGAASRVHGVLPGHNEWMAILAQGARQDATHQQPAAQRHTCQRRDHASHADLLTHAPTPMSSAAPVNKHLYEIILQEWRHGRDVLSSFLSELSTYEPHSDKSWPTLATKEGKMSWTGTRPRGPKRQVRAGSKSVLISC